MTPELIISVFGWMTVLNIGLLLIATGVLYTAGDWATGVHGRTTKLSKDDLNRAYFQWLAQFKMLTILLCLVPYLAMRIVF